MVKLSLRLKTIFDMVPNSVVADIGADHGKLIISLFEQGVITHGYAVENKIGPFERLKKALEDHCCQDFIVPMLSDGISELPEEVNTLIIAGMGGNLIIDILKSHEERLGNVKTIIIDAHSCVPKIRKEICDMGFIIADEKIIKEDGIFYEIIKFIRAGKALYGENDFEFGPILRNEKCATFKEKYIERINEIDAILAEKGLPANRLNDLINEKNRIKGALWLKQRNC